MNKLIEFLEEANKINRTVEHIIQVTLPLLQDKQVLIKILTELKKSAAYTINAILQYEYLLKKISLRKDPRMNFSTFLNKCAPNYISRDESEKIYQLFNTIKSYKNSSMVFTRNQKLVIMENGQTRTISISEIKNLLEINKKLLLVTKNKLSQTYKNPKNL